MGGEKDSNNNDMIMLKESRITKNQEGYFIDSGYQKHPVVGVSWYGAKAYAKWVGKRLLPKHLGNCPLIDKDNFRCLLLATDRGWRCLPITTNRGWRP